MTRCTIIKVFYVESMTTIAFKEYLIFYRKPRASCEIHTISKDKDNYGDLDKWLVFSGAKSGEKILLIS